MQRPSERLHGHWYWVALGVALMAFGLRIALQPNPDLTLDFPEGDKLLHAAGFACLMGWWGNLYTRRWARGWAALGCLIYGALVEVVQWFSPPRTADVQDVLADGVGIGIALLLLRTPLASVLASVERGLRRWRAD